MSGAANGEANAFRDVRGDGRSREEELRAAISHAEDTRSAAEALLRAVHRSIGT